MDSHLLLHLLQRNAPKDSEELQAQIRTGLAASQKKKEDEADTSFEKCKQNASKLVSLLGNATLREKIKEDKEFTLEKLREAHGVTLEDCQALF